MSLEHEDHLLLWFLKETGELDADLVGQFVKLLVFFLDEVDELAYFFLKIVETLTDEHSLLQLVQ